MFRSFKFPGEGRRLGCEYSDTIMTIGSSWGTRAESGWKPKHKPVHPSSSQLYFRPFSKDVETVTGRLTIACVPELAAWRRRRRSLLH
jgi:hypothetical protein